MLLGDGAMARLSSARIILFGVGGVGGWAAETLVRTGVTRLTIVDFDSVAPSNVNRQLPATSSTIGSSKVEAMKRHLLDVNPDAEIIAVDDRYSTDTAGRFDFDGYDYVIDCIDSLADKALLILTATRSRCRLVSSMGAALKTDPTQIAVTEFWRVKGCRLAAALRNRFKRSGEFPARKFKVVYSPQIVENRCDSGDSDGSRVNGSLMQVTAVAGITLASIVINEIAAAASDS